MINFKDLYNCFASELSFAVDMTPILEVIGEVEPENLTTELLTDLFGYLYDEKKIVGSVYGKYRSAVNELLYLAFCGGYIKDVPQIGVRAYTAPNLYNKPDDESLNEWIAREGACPAVTAVVLAWECGLKRCEIASLTWSSVDIKKRQIRLEDREIPLSDKAVQYLKNLHNEDLYKNMEYVLISATNTAPVSETNISVMIKRAFERAGVATVRLSDLRFDYIIKQLNCYDWEYVSYVTGVDFTSLQEHFLPYSEKETLGIKKKNMLTDAQREALTEMLKKEKESVTGLAIRFMWFAGIPMKVLPEITWDNIDLENKLLVLPDRSSEINSEFCEVLKQSGKRRSSFNQHVFLNENNGDPLDASAIHKRLIKTLVRSNILGVGTWALTGDYWYKHPDQLRVQKAPTLAEKHTIAINQPAYVCKASAEELEYYIKTEGCVNKRDVMNRFSLDEGDAKKLLHSGIAMNLVERVGCKYFLKGAVVPSNEHEKIILEYIGSNNSANSRELTKLLGLVDRRQILTVLKPLLSSGKVERHSDGRYYLANNCAERS